MKIIINCCIAVTLIAFALLVGGSTEVQAGTCTVTNLDDTGPGSLREAINCANISLGSDTITFAVAGTINVPTSPLPILSDTSGGTTIDGTTAPGYVGAPVVVLSGPGTSSFSGLEITSADNEVRALQIGSFKYGVEIDGSSASNNAVTGCYIGTDGTNVVPNGRGVRINYSALNNRIGTDGDGVHDVEERNVISGNTGHAITIYGGSGGNVIAGNYIGTDAVGSTNLGNGYGDGVEVNIAPNTRTSHPSLSSIRHEL